MKIVFLGTPDFAVPSLRALIESNNTVIGVVCQPDREGNRGAINVSPVKELALTYNIPVFQFENISKEGEETLKKLSPDIMITCAYGQILRQNILDIAPIYNVHGSLLPKYRGASPIQWSLISGEKTTGISIIKTQLGLDNGPILLQESTPIAEDETAGTLFSRLALLGSKVLISALNLLQSGDYTLIPQNEALVTSYKTLKKADGIVDFNQDAVDVFNHYRGVTPWPSSYAFLEGKILKFIKLSLTDFLIAEKKYLPGTLIVDGFNLYLVCKNNSVLKVEELLFEGGKRLNAKNFINGKNVNNIVLKGK